MGIYEVGCACEDRVSGADSNLVKAETQLKQAKALRAQAAKDKAAGNWTHAADLEDKASALEKQANQLSALPRTKARIAARHSITGAGVVAAVGIAATLGIIGIAASNKKT